MFRLEVVGSGVEPLAHRCSDDCSTEILRSLSYHNHICFTKIRIYFQTSKSFFESTTEYLSSPISVNSFTKIKNVFKLPKKFLKKIIYPDLCNLLVLGCVCCKIFLLRLSFFFRKKFYDFHSILLLLPYIKKYY